MSYVLISKNCPACNGKGKQTFNTEAPEDKECSRCKGVGYLPWGRLEGDIHTLIGRTVAKKKVTKTK
jgi:DnaJ-class molecular chaperone